MKVCAHKIFTCHVEVSSGTKVAAASIKVSKSPAILHPEEWRRRLLSTVRSSVATPLEISLAKSSAIRKWLMSKPMHAENKFISKQEIKKTQKGTRQRSGGMPQAQQYTGYQSV